MDVAISLLSQYSLEFIIVFIIVILIAFKGVCELWEYFYDKFKVFFNKQDKADRCHEELITKLDCLSDQLTSVKDDIHVVDGRIGNAEQQLVLTTRRLQDADRSYLIDSHHKFVYQIRVIDDMNLQNLERRYLYYKSSGGNSFVDSLMEEVRRLPRTNLYVPESDEEETEGE